MDANSIIKLIVAKTGRSEVDVRGLIEDKKEKFAGLLKDDGAAYMVARELGVDVDEEKKGILIGDLVKGMRNLTLTARVLHVYAPKKFEKGERKGRYCKVLLGDATGQIMLTLWNDDIEKLGKIECGSVVTVKNCNVGEFNGKLSLTLGFNGEVVLAEGIDESVLPKSKHISARLADLADGMQNVDVFARVLHVSEMREFERDGEKAVVVRFEVADGTARLQAVAWRNLAEKASKLYAGELVKIEGADVKKGLNGLELHLGSRARIIERPVAPFEIPGLEEITGKKFSRKKISELKAGLENIEVVGEISGILKGNLLYNFCPQCKKKASGSTCEDCGAQTRQRAVVSLQVDDGSGSISCSLFGKAAEVALQMSTIEIANKLKEVGAENLIAELKKRIIGRTIIVRGNTSQRMINPEEIEIIGSDALLLRHKEEIENLLKILSEMNP